MSLYEKVGLAAVARTRAELPPFEVFENETLQGTYPQVDLHLSSDQEQGKGTLYITTKSRDLYPVCRSPSRRIVWFADGGEEGYGVGFYSVVLHALTSDLIEGKQCVLLQLDPPEGDDEIDPTVTLVPSDQDKGNQV